MTDEEAQLFTEIQNATEQAAAKRADEARAAFLKEAADTVVDVKQIADEQHVTPETVATTMAAIALRHGVNAYTYTE